MSGYKCRAVEVAKRLHRENRIEYGDYLTLSLGLDEIETLAERDAKLEQLWNEFSDVPMNPETECMEEQFLAFPVGTHREVIWHWFDKRYSKGVAHLLYGGSELKKYRVRISELRYGEVEVEARNEDHAKTIASGKEIEWFDSETTDMTAERIE